VRALKSDGKSTRQLRWAVAGFAALVTVAGCSGGGVAAPALVSAPATVLPTASAGSTATSAQPVADQPTGGGLSTGSGASTGPQRCTTAELSLSLGAPEGTAGSIVQALVFTNTGSRTCELRGFPGVSYVGHDGHQVGPAAVMNGERGPQVPIAPRGTAVADLALVDVQNFDEAACRPTPVRGLQVYPPGDTASIFVPREGDGCDATPPDPQLLVNTITRR
jgi:hypothetical protein